MNILNIEKNERKRLLVLDGSSLLSTGFYATARDLLFAKTDEAKELAYTKLMKSPDGRYTNGVYMFFKTLMPMMQKHQITHLAVCLDRSRKSTFRKELSSAYKATRSTTPKPLSSQFALLGEVLERLGIKTFSDPYLEADDFAGSISKKFEGENGVEIFLHSKDADYIQLVNERTRLWFGTGKAQEMYSELGFSNEEMNLFNIPAGVFEYTPQYVEYFEGIEPIQIIDVKSLEGDKSDNIPGVSGAGEKAVRPLLREFSTVEGIYSYLEDEFFTEKFNYVAIKDFFETLRSKYELGETELALYDIPTAEIKNIFESVYAGDADEKYKAFGKEIDTYFTSNLKSPNAKEATKFLKEDLGISRPPIKNLFRYRADAYLSKQLATIKTDIESVQELVLDDLSININKTEADIVFTELGMKSLIPLVK